MHNHAAQTITKHTIITQTNTACRAWLRVLGSLDSDRVALWSVEKGMLRSLGDLRDGGDVGCSVGPVFAVDGGERKHGSVFPQPWS